MSAYAERYLHLEQKDYDELVRLALWEDAFYRDITSLSLFRNEKKAQAHIISRQRALVCGLDVVAYVFSIVDPTLELKPLFCDGETVKEEEVLIWVEGSLNSILAAERVALNFLSLLSGIATRTQRLVEKLKPMGIKLLDTRKTIPGHRKLSKYAVAVGGGYNHRLNLATMGLIKDNHRVFFSNLGEAVRRFRQVFPDMPLQVEIESKEELLQVLPLEPNFILFDNMAIPLLKECVAIVKNFNEKKGTQILTEASGGYNEENLHLLDGSGVDFVSMGSLTNTITPVDFSLEILN
ncbi:MAG: carboxylating nicotinate-nucleotide diphosphorylase [Leptospiraceae bacterium]|nr:carboxylating nicotinate-nucleotide diphosphorylase [Leptospiraceae bacterium]MDW8306625.1 carboxylating nicotinate-nucleotide diphosphorylase [Leptospiraceae bacterium]